MPCDDHTLFTTAEGIESLWERSEPLLLADPQPVRPYAPGSWGPNSIHQLVAPHALAVAVRAGLEAGGSPIPRATRGPCIRARPDEVVERLERMASTKALRSIQCDWELAEASRRIDNAALLETLPTTISMAQILEDLERSRSGEDCR